MSIKIKTSVTIFIAAMVLCIAVYITSETLLTGNALDHEKEITKQYLERISNALEYKRRSLNPTLKDWADWDDTYNFIQNRNEEYIRSNLTESTFINLKLNLIAYIDISGNIVYGTMMDFDNQKMSEVNHNILVHLKKDSPIISQTGTNKNISGFLSLPEGILLISSKAILKSDESGPAMGTLIFGRFINDSEIKEIQELTGLSFTYESLDSTNVPSGFEKANQTSGNGEQYYIHNLDGNHIAGYGIINDIYGKNQFLTKIVLDRKFYQKAKEGTRFFIIVLLICGVALSGVCIAVLQKSVISRLLELNRFMTEISSRHDTSLRVQISGDDEISNLAHEMNRMLEELNKTHEDNQRLIKEVIGYDELKNEFFSNISHEFRTPINVLLSTLQLINLQQQNTQVDPNSLNIVKYTNIMKQNCYRLLRLANNLIDITRIDSGFFEISLSNCNVVEVIEDITLSVAEYIRNKGISLQFDTDVEEKVIAIDADKIERIMLNLLSNAVKFTENQGSIYVNIKDKGESIEVSVKDTGIGIPKDKLAVIFERFRQVNSLLTRSHEGSGIGLSLVKNLVELHGGNIRVESEAGIGTEFIFELPAKVCSEESAQKLTSVASQGKVDKINIEFADIYSI